jgi:hypothetical protein
VPRVLDGGGYHFSHPSLIATVGAHIWVFDHHGVRVLANR